MSAPKKTALLIGCGRSTQELIDYGTDRLPESLLTVGMNFAYREYEKTDWFPKVYGFCDVKTLENKVEELTALVARHPETTFYAAPRVSQICLPKTPENLEWIARSKKNPGSEEAMELEKFRRTVSIDFPDAPNLLPIKHGPTGVRLSSVVIDQGIERILLIGADANYVEKIPEATEHPDDGHLPLEFRRLIISRDVEENPNYFFNDYQRVGDIYSTPRGATSHISGWTQVAELAEAAGVEVINCSPISRITDFEKRDLAECFAELT
ncbi:MAG: hypothetical protein ACJAYU_002811 [Bradymonadia bacterium]|jgi:hypothetical protein